MCSMSEQTKCAVEASLRGLEERFTALESKVDGLMNRLDSHDKLVRWGKNAAFWIFGAAVGAGILNPKTAMFLSTLF